TLSRLAQTGINELLPKALVHDVTWFASESFNQYSKLAPSVFSFIGMENEDYSSGAQHHNNQFDVDDKDLFNDVLAISTVIGVYLSIIPQLSVYEDEKGYSILTFKLRGQLKLMAQINKILVAFVGSKHGLKALNYAKKLTIDNHALLTVLYVHDDIYDTRLNESKTRIGDEFIQIAPGPLVDNDPITTVEERYVTIDQIPIQITSIAKEKL